MVARRNKGEKMYSLTIHFGPNAVCWQFLFKEKGSAADAFAKAMKAVDGSEGSIRFEDDFGQTAIIESEEFHGALLEDLDLVEEAQIQRSLVNARAQAKLNSRASQDPTLRAAQAMRGPAMIQPMGRG